MVLPLNRYLQSNSSFPQGKSSNGLPLVHRVAFIEAMYFHKTQASFLAYVG